MAKPPRIEVNLIEIQALAGTVLDNIKDNRPGIQAYVDNWLSMIKGYIEDIIELRKH